MARETKPTTTKEESLDLLDIRLGRVLEVEIEPEAQKKSHRLKVDFGKFGTKTSVARLTHHSLEEIKNSLVFGILNFPPRQVGNTLSEVLVLGVQLPKVDSGEATFITPAKEAKLGSKLF